MEEQSIVFRHPLLKLFIWRLYNKEGAAKWERRSLRIEACCGYLRPSEKLALRLGGEGGSFKAMYGYPLTGFEKAEEIPEKIVAASESSRAAPRWDLPRPNMPLSQTPKEKSCAGGSKKNSVLPYLKIFRSFRHISNFLRNKHTSYIQILLGTAFKGQSLFCP